MNTQRILNDEEKVKEFVGDFSKLFKDLKAWTNNAEIIIDFSENEVEMDTEVVTTNPP